MNWYGWLCVMPQLNWYGWFCFIIAACIIVFIVTMGLHSLQHQSRHHSSRPIKMANEIRHKGPVVGQTVLYVTSGIAMPAFIRSVNADGTANLATLPGGSVIPDANNVPFDPTLTKDPSWFWSDDL